LPDPSNPTGRVIDVLNFLAARPTESFSRKSRGIWG
jgi:hypothetical protein